MKTHTAIKAYGNTGLESEVYSADPHKLITLLFQGALLAIAKAKQSILAKDEPAKKCASISQAISIIDDGLNACLDKKVGGDLALNLSSLYDYMVYRLTLANLKNDLDALDEVTRTLNELKGAWESIRPTPSVQQAKITSRPVEKTQLTYGKM
jgi:flagellar protein FliS